MQEDDACDSMHILVKRKIVAFGKPTAKPSSRPTLALPYTDTELVLEETLAEFSKTIGLASSVVASAEAVLAGHDNEV